MGRRPNLAGRQRANGTWEIRVSLTTITGAKVVKSVYGRTQAEAQNRAHQLLYESGRMAPDGLTFAALADRWRATWDLRPSTRRSYEYALSYVLPRLGRRQVAEIALPEMVGLLYAIESDRVARLVRTVLGTLLAFGVMVGAIRHNPLAGFRFPRRYTPARIRHTLAEVEAACAMLDDETALLVRFLADTGLRVWVEAHPLTIEHLGRHADEWFVTVPRSKTLAGEGRVVPIGDARVVTALLGREDRLFPLSQATYKRRLAGSGIQLQALRRLAITRWCEAGEPLDVVRARAGHTDLRTTLEIYNEVAKSRMISGGSMGTKWVRVSDVLGDGSPI